ncbi:MAG TPA: hypothetical protein VNO14_08645, partial [Blastocatellia bacterium]|nr:hypothetical protein [Blastocatellia bacterium]
SMLRALGNVAPSQLLDARLFDFRSLSNLSADLADELDSAIGVHTGAGGPTLAPVTLGNSN